MRFWWERVCSSVPPAHSLSSEISARNINRSIKAVFAKLGVSYARSYTSHGFRRGKAQELKESGSQWATVAGIGGRLSLAFRGYLGATSDISKATARLLIDDYGPSSSEEEEAPFFGGASPSLPLFAVRHGRWGFSG